jgi:hypothetical protein
VLWGHKGSGFLVGVTALCTLPVTAVLRDMVWQAYQIQCTKMESLRLVLVAVAKILLFVGGCHAR